MFECRVDCSRMVQFTAAKVCTIYVVLYISYSPLFVTRKSHKKRNLIRMSLEFYFSCLESHLLLNIYIIYNFTHWCNVCLARIVCRPQKRSESVFLNAQAHAMRIQNDTHIISMCVDATCGYGWNYFLI